MPEWNKEYYDILCFYFFEPQHLGRKKNPESNIKSEPLMLQRVGSLEVALNHQFNYFFRLAPNALVSRLLTSVIQDPVDDRFDLIGREFEAKFHTNGITQPDIYLDGNANRVSIELKLGSKSSLEQVAKYCVLHCLAQEKSMTNKSDHLVFLGKTNFRGLWKDKYGSIKDLKSAILSGGVLEQVQSRLKSNGPSLEMIKSMLNSISINSTSYREVGDFLVMELTQLNGREHDETLAKLLSGMIRELEDRNLLT